MLLKGSVSLLLAFSTLVVFANHGPKPIVTGADQTGLYLPLLKGKRVGVLGNPSSIIGSRSLVDSLHDLGVDIKEIFGPEHGFRGKASNGAKVADEIDSATGIPIISLYGPKRKPSKADMDAIDIMIFDVQDVGCRFYTNINVLRNIMESCAESGKELLILDRPDPNGYVDGPILDMTYKSGVGQFPVPIVHGMTIGEFAQMINGEGWLPNKEQCPLKIIPVKNYSHDMSYKLPVWPSPNLNSQQSILLYPSLCLFEGTIISQGRGTHMPFTVLGNPDLKGAYAFSFTPESIPGMSETPLHEGQACYGLDLRGIDADSLRRTGKLNLSWMMELYKAYPYKEKFFDYHQSKQMGDINKLAGVAAFKEQIASGMSEADIRKSWEPGLSAYKEMRKKYLLYPDGVSPSKFVPAKDRHISYEGRILMTQDAAVLMWPGTDVRVDFEGTELSARLKDQDTANYYNVVVDGIVTRKIHPDTTRQDYVLADGLSDGRHSVELFKRTEWDKGKTWFYGFSFDGKTRLEGAPKRPARKMEFFGNSITCGYGIEDPTGNSPTGFFENNYDTYAAITARHFNAQCHYTAKSGIGVMVSWFPLIMPEMYNRLDPTDSNSRWDFSSYVPDLVVINLLQNDAWITTMPTNEQFKRRFGTQRPSEDFIIESYRNFVHTVRQTYPKARIICMLGNMDITREGSPWPGYVQKAVQELNDPRIFTLVVPYKNTPGHPRTEEQKAMAETLIAFIDSHINW